MDSQQSEIYVPHLIFTDETGGSRSFPFAPGESVLAVAQRNGIELEGACNGAMACSTCHVIVAAIWFDRIAKASVAEQDMLDFASGASRTSRLGCQIILTEALDGIRMTAVGS